MEIYADGWAHCFGCGMHTTVQEVALRDHAMQLPSRLPVEKPKEDINASLQRITSLPKATIRGLDLHFDDLSYYIVWPDLSYYNRRYFDATANGKYKCPSGHAKRLFVCSDGKQIGTDKGFQLLPLLIVEGEINAMSAYKACPWLNIVSPGGSGDFYAKGKDNNLQHYLRYGTIYLVVDKDKAGAIAAIELKSKLAPHGVVVNIKMLDKDFNDTLVQDGQEKLESEIREIVGMPKRVSRYG